MARMNAWVTGLAQTPTTNDSRWPSPTKSPIHKIKVERIDSYAHSPLQPALNFLSVCLSVCLSNCLSACLSPKSMSTDAALEQVFR